MLEFIPTNFLWPTDNICFRKPKHFSIFSVLGFSSSEIMQIQNEKRVAMEISMPHLQHRIARNNLICSDH